MAYCTIVNLKNTIPAEMIRQLTDDNLTDEIDTEKLDYAIKQSDDLIDSYLRGRYQLPLTTIPAMIVDLSVRVAIYFLFRRSLLYTLPDPIKEDYGYCTKILVGIQQGKINPFPVGDEPGFFATNKDATQKIFTETPVIPVLTPSMTTTQRSTGQNNWNSYLV